MSVRHQPDRQQWAPSRRSACPGAGAGPRQLLTRTLGPKRPDSAGLTPPCSIPRPDIRAWRGEIVGSQSALRDDADGRYNEGREEILGSGSAQ